MLRRIKEYNAEVDIGEVNGEELRELVHGRWRIENGVFKRLNALVRSRHYANHSSTAQEMLLRLWMLGLTLLGAYLFEQGLRIVEQTWKSMKVMG